MATGCLNRVSAALETPSAVEICLERFRSAEKVDKQTAATEYASATLNRLRELLKSEHGIRICKLEDKEIASLVENVQTKETSSISAKEYQEIMERIVKYAALRARRSPRMRFAFGVVCSAASAVAVTAVTAAASTGVLVAVAPLGAAAGALAVGASSCGLSKRDKRRAAEHTASTPATAAPNAAEEIAVDVEASPSAAQADEAAAAVPPAAATAGAEDATAVPASSPAADRVAESAVKVTGPMATAHPPPVESPTRFKSDDLVSAVVELSSPAAPAAAPAKETPFSGVTVPFSTPRTGVVAASAAPAPAADNTEHILAAVGAALADREPESLPLPELLRCDTPDNADSAHELLTPAASLDVAKSSELPPLGKKKKSASKKLKKSISKGYKQIKKAMSISSSADLDAAADAAVARADRDAAALPPPGGKPPSGFSFRRSFSRDSARDMDGEALSVQGSDASATLKKMKELLRRSFTISPRASQDLSSGGNTVHAL